ncbi:undecaprenyldiphospho-muramoylpentapeptide beta-N-acetylglucosaminyltransferase [Oceanivirga salmonicida]|uniref:undecaprenyldiphospho-muramoylpentapeptide beta-N-acetylglucosaminyltransferase n=1 Tax=Oceanivirga salmonicida TaxID=1769291 RepID=UPI000829F975|nr:undecaprenyldiphospho-muramoylpentapeptide beta-N-acetylglucosaminyltransferase [Oceanivirga salmonicida]
MKNIAFTTGGTGGHIYPALALANKMRNEGYKIIFIGTRHRMEKDIVPANNFRFYGLDILPFNKVSSILKIFPAIYNARKILQNSKIDVLIGFGNYISIPAILAAKTLGIKVYLQEQNILMGMANKYCNRFSKKVFLAFKETLKYIPEKKQDKYVVTGNPLREEFYNITKEDARQKLEIDENKKVILIMGGSLGAKQINDAVINNLEKINKKKNLILFWSTGQNLFDDVHAKVKNLSNIILMPYFDNVPELMAASDLVICRSGASTISELLELTKPSVLIPYDFVGQKENAEMLEYVNGAKMYTNETANEAVEYALGLCENKEILEFMEKNLKKLSVGNSTENILKIIKEEN